MPNTEPLFSEARTARPGAKRQGLIALMVVAALIAILALGFVAARPHEEAMVLRQAEAAVVEKKTLRDLLSVGGTLELGSTESLVSPERAMIAEVLVAEGDPVKAGQIVAIVSDADLRSQIDSKRAELSKLQREIEQATAVLGFDARAQALDESKARREFAAAQAERQRVAALLERGLAAQIELDSAESKLAAAKEALDSLLLARERSDTLARIEAQNRASDAKLLEDSLALLVKEAESCKVRSSQAGVVYSLSATRGKMAAQYEELAVIGAPSSIRAAVDLPETRAALVKLGTKATVYIGETPWEGRVDFLASYATSSSTGSGSTLRANIVFSRIPGNAVAGSSVTAELLLGEIKDALVLPRGPYLTSGDYAVAYVVRGAEARQQPVTFGTADGQSIQVLTGLAEGDLVLTGNYAEFIHLKSVHLENVTTEEVKKERS